jgi:hypothetical protein
VPGTGTPVTKTAALEVTLCRGCVWRSPLFAANGVIGENLTSREGSTTEWKAFSGPGKTLEQEAQAFAGAGLLHYIHQGTSAHLTVPAHLQAIVEGVCA